MQFGAEPLFENISAKFGNGHRYGLIGANGCGKSTFMKILSGELAPSSGNVSVSTGNKVSTLGQDQFAFCGTDSFEYFIEMIFHFDMKV